MRCVAYSHATLIRCPLLAADPVSCCSGLCGPTQRLRDPLTIVAEQCPEDVDQSAGECDGGLDVPLMFGAFTLVELSRRPFSLRTTEGRP